MTHLLRNLMKPYRNFSFTVFSIVLGVLFYQISEYFTDREVMFGNYGALHTDIDIALSVMLAIIFPIFITGFVYKGLLFGKRELFKNKFSTGWG
jgi:hypothetical protein